MLNKILSLLSLFLSISGCQSRSDPNKIMNSTIFNIVKPGNGIYVVEKKNVDKNELKNNFYEKLHYYADILTKVERYNPTGNLTDELSVAAVTMFEYNTNSKVKYLKYFDKNYTKAIDKNFGYWSIEYIYDEQNRVVMEIYRDAESKFLKVPRDNSGKIAKADFLSPVLTYEYLGDKLKIKALDQNFNLLKEVIGEKPCVPFIDCGESD